jgi:ARG and Rhodanese-Phosphatase-superfamily-associated Protein domain
MSLKLWVPILALAALAAITLFPRFSAEAGEVSSGYKVLDPIQHGNLTVFPIVSATSHNTSEFITLDEGVRSGEVVVTEYGNVQPLMRRRPIPIERDGARVNQLVLVNNSKRPLILLAGEIVTGGKQDRIIGKDRIVPAESDPIDLNVFCVEPGRWTATSAKFGSMGFAMAQPAVRAKAMGAKDQQQVWSEVRKAQGGIAESVVVAGSPEAAPLRDTTSYAQVMENPVVKQQVDSVAEPIQRDYQSVIHQLRDRNAVGVVVAVNRQIIWSDIFASTNLLEKYWPKLVRSYAAEAIVTRGKGGDLSVKSAQAFLDNMTGRRETVETEPGLYRHTEITGDGFKAFELTSLLPKTDFNVHVAKMAE